VEPRSRTSISAERGARRALSLALLAVQLVVFTLGAALAGQSHARTGSTAVPVVTASTADGVARVAATPDARLDQAARARADRTDRNGAAPPLDLALPPAIHVVAPASLVGSLDWRSAAREHRPSRSVVNGARGPPPA
jgi:hypothetical protein